MKALAYGGFAHCCSNLAAFFFVHLPATAMSLGRTEAPLPLRGQESLEEALAGGSLGWAAPAAMPPSCGLAEGAGGCQQPQPSSLRQPKGLFPLCTADLS